MQPDVPAPRRTSRRQFLAGTVAAVGAVGATTAGLTGYALGAGSGGSDAAATQAAAPPRGIIDAHGPHQGGIERPALLQRHLELAVRDVDDVAGLPDALDAIGVRIAAMARGEDPALAGLSPAGLTVTVGIGSGVVAALLPGAPGEAELPAFRRDEISADRRGGDLLLMCRSDDGAVASLARDALSRMVAGSTRWGVSGFTTAPDGPATRNVVGFHDGLSIPKTDAERDAAVWVDDPRLAGATVAAIRVMPIDTAAFTAMSLLDQERAVGRARATGAPLSGGTAEDDPDLFAKSDAGAYDIPVDAHVRRAHPLPAGLGGLMLRRSYSFSEVSGGQGSVFVSFQRDLDFFVRTQRRLDESDALLAHTRTTASGSFLVLPGFTAARGLGSSLRG